MKLDLICITKYKTYILYELYISYNSIKYILTFYINYINIIGGKLEEFLPPVDMLLKEQELGELATSSNFQFLIKLVYEYAYRNF